MPDDISNKQLQKDLSKLERKFDGFLEKFEKHRETEEEALNGIVVTLTKQEGQLNGLTDWKKGIDASNSSIKTGVVVGVIVSLFGAAIAIFVR